MAKTDLQVKVTADTRWVIAWVKAMKLAAYVIGPTSAMRYVEAGARRLIRYRLDDGPWHWLRADEETSA